MYSGVWLSRKSFYGKSIPVFGSSKYFTENTLRKINSHVWFGKYFTENSLDHFTENDLESAFPIHKIQEPAFPIHICNNTKIMVIWFNIKHNHSNIPIIFI